MVGIIRKVVIIFLIAISLLGCKSEKAKQKISKIKPTTQQLLEPGNWETFNNINDFYKKIDILNPILIKSKYDCIYDTMYFCYEFATCGGSETHSYIYYLGKVIPLRPHSEEFVSYLNSVKKYFLWDKIDSNNAKIFFALLMCGYENYGEVFPRSKFLKFPFYYCKTHEMRYIIEGDFVNYKFTYVDMKRPYKLNISLIYDKVKKNLEIDTLSNVKMRLVPRM
jgi:hypothetical protein